MKIILLCAMFAPVVYLALRQKKWYLYLLMAFIAVLPEQFSVELHDKLPLLSGSRVLILIMLGFWLWQRWKEKRLVFPISLMIFLGVNILVSLVNLQYGITGEIKRVALFVLERVLLVIMLADTIKTREEFELSIDFAIMGSSILAVIGIVQTVFQYDISSPLFLTETLAVTELSQRMGLLRAYGTYNAIAFGCYCAIMTMLVAYRLYITRKLIYAGAMSLLLCALICTLSRSVWLCLAGIIFVMLIFGRMKLLRRLAWGFAMTAALCVVLCCLQPKLGGALLETGKSSINTVLSVLPESWVEQMFPNGIWGGDAEAPDKKPGFELSEDFGLNGEDPTYSRMAQWTAVAYMAKEGQLLFGQGYNALSAGRIHFFYDRWSAKWFPTTYLDVGLVALMADGGLVGALSYIALLGYMVFVSLKRRIKGEQLDFYRLTAYMIPLYLLLNFTAAFLHMSAIWVFIGLFYAWKNLDEEGKLALPQ